MPASAISMAKTRAIFALLLFDLTISSSLLTDKIKGFLLSLGLMIFIFFP